MVIVGQAADGDVKLESIHRYQERKVSRKACYLSLPFVVLIADVYCEGI